MIAPRPLLMTCALALAALSGGCHRDEHHDHAHDHEHEYHADHDHEHHADGDHHDHDDHDHGSSSGHSHGADEHGEPDTGIRFEAGKGLLLTEEARERLGIELTQAITTNLPIVIRFNVQVFGETHHPALLENDHSGCDIHGSGFVTADQAALLRPSQPLDLLSADKEVVHGVILRILDSLPLNEPEVLVGMTNAGALVRPGEFLSARVEIPRETPTIAIPETALLRTAEGTFVYRAQDGVYARTPVRAGSEAAGLVEILNGLAAGDRIVRARVATLWLVELRATRGGGHSH